MVPRKPHGSLTLASPGRKSAFHRFVQKNRGRFVREADRATEEAHKRCVDLITALALREASQMNDGNPCES